MSGDAINGANEKVIRVGTRKSQLAIIQTDLVIDKIKEIFPKMDFEIVSMSTIGDKILDKQLSKIGEKSLFTKELEVALADGSVDFVVHSLKDLPTTLPKGMAIAAICKREDPSDAVILHPTYEGMNLEKLPQGSVIGTSSVRRISQLKKAYPHLLFKDIRGNLNTRLSKLENDDKYAGLILASAGILRMGWGSKIAQILSPDICMHAVGQGAIAVEIRSDDAHLRRLLASISDEDTVIGCIAERAFMKALEGGCSVPVAAHSKLVEGKLNLTGGVFSLDGSQSVVGSLDARSMKGPASVDEGDVEIDIETLSGVSVDGISTSKIHEAAKLGTQLAQQLLDKGAEDILCKLRQRK